MVQMENGGYAKLLFGSLEKHYVWYRIYGHEARWRTRGPTAGNCSSTASRGMRSR